MKAPTVMILTMGMLLCFGQGAKSNPEAEPVARRSGRGLA